MKGTLLAPRLRLLLLVAALSGTAAQAAPFPSYSPDYPPIAGWTGPVFSLSQKYPTTLPRREKGPWLKLDPKTESLAYLQAVLDYALQGNVQVDFDGAKNRVRPWFHAPWLHSGCLGREFVHGLTRERSSRPFELHSLQTDFAENWAVGLYNAPAGFVLGQVWKNPAAPDASKANFPEGSVSVKLLFTAAPVAQVPFLEDSYTWQAHIYPPIGSDPCAQPKPARQIGTMRLLQVDLAVKDSRVGPTGWIFGTFIYDASAKGKTPWKRLVPVGAIWGNDPAVTSRMNDDGAFLNTDLKESVVNAALLAPASGKKAYVTHLGLGGRVNGPVDNRISSCMSCHGRASVPSQAAVPAGVSRPSDYKLSDFSVFFANIPAGTGTPPPERLDYSLQLAFGIRNLAVCQRNPTGLGCGPMPMMEMSKAALIPLGPPVTRE